MPDQRILLVPWESRLSRVATVSELINCVVIIRKYSLINLFHRVCVVLSQVINHGYFLSAPRYKDKTPLFLRAGGQPKAPTGIFPHLHPTINPNR